ncbi:hypothetical protein, partial [Vibrio paucivorans]
MKRAISFSLSDITNRSVTFDSLGELYSFAKQEQSFWKKAVENYPSPTNQTHSALNAHNNFTSLINLIDGWEAKLDSWDDAQLNSQLNSQQRNFFNSLRGVWLWSGHPFINIFLHSHKEYGLQGATSFLSFIVHKQVQSVNQKEGFIGSLLAYEYEIQGSALVERSERASLEHLRSELEATTSKLIGEVDSFKDSFGSWDETSRESWGSWINKSELEHSAQL